MKQIIFLILITTLFGCKSDMDKTIKEGHFDACKKHNVETLVNSFFANPKWESFVSPDDDKYHLNVVGQITYDNKPVNALIQFEMDGNDRWQINSFEINGEAQNDLMVAELINEMCLSAGN
ncbi:MAG: hypothetical protein EXR21_06680 [Flavobacteriaceae bacterium]|nr:hypothetical protein [Flavobacteriaceae bacterium]